MWIFELLYALCALLLSVYGFNSLVLTALYLWHRRDDPAQGKCLSCSSSCSERVRDSRSGTGESRTRREHTTKLRPTGRLGTGESRTHREHTTKLGPIGRSGQAARDSEIAATDRSWPHVTIQLPMYNELHTVERLLGAVAAMDYPRERLEIQVIDDSTDGTRSLVVRVVERLRHQGIDAVHILRADRAGYKAGALAAALDSAKGELIAVFDADFLPFPDFLRQTVPYLDDPHVGCVQTRWGHINRNYSPLTRAQALMLDGHFGVEQTARSRSGLFTSFNGTAGVWRRACIDDAGGWSGDTLTEDLDLSYRAQLRGWRIAYLPRVVVPAELPVQISAFKRQQARWAQGSIQTALGLIGPLFRARQPLGVKLEGFFHLTAYLAHPLMLLSVLLLLPATLLSGAVPTWLHRWVHVLTPWLMAAALGPPLLYTMAQIADGRGWARHLCALPLLMLAGIGIALNNTIAVFKALLGVRQGFLRTPKYDVQRNGEPWIHTAYALSVDPLVWGELAIAFYALSLVVLRIVSWGLVPWLLLYAAGFLYVGATGFVQGLRRRRWLARSAVRSEIEMRA